VPGAADFDPRQPRPEGTRGSVRFVTTAMSSRAKATLMASVVLSSLTVWGVHYMQQAERDVRQTIFAFRTVLMLPSALADDVSGCCAG
jgi:hypothetical protein